MRPSILALAALLTACGAVSEAVGTLSADNDAEGRLPADPSQQVGFKGELMYGDRAWTPDECVWADVEGRHGMIFASESEGLAMAVWAEGVPQGESNVWFVDVANPPVDNNYQVGSTRCGKVKTNLGEADAALVTGATKVNCEGFASELRFKNCVNTLQGAAAASVSWPPL